MLRQTRVAVSFVVLVFMLMMAGTRGANARSKLPDPINAGVAEKLYRLDCRHSLANDESVWTPGENVGRNTEFSSTCWLIKHGSEWLLWDTGVPETALNDPRGWSTLPKLIVYHLDRSLTDQLAEIGLKPGDIGRVATSHTHGDHIGNVGLFHNSTIVMQHAEYRAIAAVCTTHRRSGRSLGIRRRSGLTIWSISSSIAPLSTKFSPSSSASMGIRTRGL